MFANDHSIDYDEQKEATSRYFKSGRMTIKPFGLFSAMPITGPDG
jgi:hypothetical protein